MNKIQEIEAKIEKIKNTLNQLYNQLYLGYCSFLLTQHIQRALVGGHIKLMQELLKTTYFACGNSAVIVPRTLVEEGKRKENINLEFLFREWEWVINTLDKLIKKRRLSEDDIETLWQNQNTYLSVFRRKDDIPKSISEHRRQLKSLEPILSILEDKRRYIAHLDKKLINSDNGDTPVYTDDLNKVYQELFDIVRTYYDYVDERLEVNDLQKLQQIMDTDFSNLRDCMSSS